MVVVDTLSRMVYHILYRIIGQAVYLEWSTMQQRISSKHRSPAIRRLITDITSKIEIGELRTGDYLPSAHSLAKTYDVGYASVIRAYKTMVEAGVLETVQGRGAFVSGKTTSLNIDEIVVCLPSTSFVSHAGNPHSDWVFQQLLAAINAATLTRKIKLQLLFVQEVGEYFLEVIESLSSTSGVIFILEAPPAWVLRLERLKIPYALMFPRFRRKWEDGLPCIEADYYGVMYATAGELFQKGYKRPIFIGITTDEQEQPRYLGFSAAVADAGLKMSTIECAEISEEAGYRAMEEYLSAGHDKSFDLIVGGNDLRAIGVIKCLKNHGYKVPEDVGVLGFDDIPAAEEIGLSTVRLPIREVGEAGIYWFLDTVVGYHGDDIPKLEVACPFVQRNSTH